jgi:hypothetical protein
LDSIFAGGLVEALVYVHVSACAGERDALRDVLEEVWKNV